MNRWTRDRHVRPCTTGWARGDLLLSLCIYDKANICGYIPGRLRPTLDYKARSLKIAKRIGQAWMYARVYE